MREGACTTLEESIDRPGHVNREVERREDQGDEKGMEGGEERTRASKRAAGGWETRVGKEGGLMDAGSLRRVARGFVDDYTPRVCG